MVQQVVCTSSTQVRVESGGRRTRRRSGEVEVQGEVSGGRRRRSGCQENSNSWGEVQDPREIMRVSHLTTWPPDHLAT